MELNPPPPSSQDPNSELSEPNSGQPRSISADDARGDVESIYQKLSTYSFDTDQDYQLGLAAILGHPETPATDFEVQHNQDLVLQAKCFYFARKIGVISIDPLMYKSWFETQTSHGSSTALDEIKKPFADSAGQLPTPVTTESGEQPPYPMSFAHIVDLITQNKPIPGIEEIPTTVLEPGSSKQDHTPRRRKPWETSDSGTNLDNETSNPNVLRTEEIAPAVREMHQKDSSANVEGLEADSRQRHRQGVVRILQPNAIADTGLIATDD